MPNLFRCENPECKKTFIYSAKLIENKPKPSIDDMTYEETETQVCPFCLWKEFVVVEEPQPTAEEIAHVYVADLHSGENSEIDALLAKGWKIVARYAKAYVLELPKEHPTVIHLNSDATELPEAEQEDAKPQVIGDLWADSYDQEVKKKTDETAKTAESTLIQTVKETRLLSPEEATRLIDEANATYDKTISEIPDATETAEMKEFFKRNPGLREKVDDAKRKARGKDHIDDIVEAQRKGEIPK
jgi:hypothetical protein